MLESALLILAIATTESSALAIASTSAPSRAARDGALVGESSPDAGAAEQAKPIHVDMQNERMAGHRSCVSIRLPPSKQQTRISTLQAGPQHPGQLASGSAFGR